LNLLFWMANLMADRSPQFELKLLTKFLFIRRVDISALSASLRSRFGNALRVSHSTRLSNICALHPRSVRKADTMPASKAVRPQPNKPWTKIQPAMGRFDYNQKIGKSERTSSERGLSGLQSEDTSFTASCCQPYPKKRTT
jgi:hypothetical protein